MQLTELQFYINNIVQCLGILVILSARRQDNYLNSLINFSTILKVNYLQTTQQASVLQSTLQAQPNIYLS